MERRAATPAGTARAEDPGLSEAREASEAVPAESVRSQRKSTFLIIIHFKRKKTVGKPEFVYSLRAHTMGSSLNLKFMMCLALQSPKSNIPRWCEN